MNGSPIRAIDEIPRVAVIGGFIVKIEAMARMSW